MTHHFLNNMQNGPNSLFFTLKSSEFKPEPKKQVNEFKPAQTAPVKDIKPV